jgi:hypothetical protein
VTADPPDLDDVYSDDILRRIDRQLAEPQGFGPAVGGQGPGRSDGEASGRGVAARSGGGSVASLALTAALLRGVGDVFDDDHETRHPAEFEPGLAPGPQAVEVHLMFHDPRQSRAIVRPWLL